MSIAAKYLLDVRTIINFGPHFPEMYRQLNWYMWHTLTSIINGAAREK